MEAPSSVNKKQFFAILYKFMLENRIHKEWFEKSMNYKLHTNAWGDYWRKFNFNENDDFKTHLEKCIDVYIENTKESIHSKPQYHFKGKQSIYGFFRFIPSSFDTPNWTRSKWCEISDKFENLYCHTKFEDNGEIISQLETVKENFKDEDN